jgi:hypothetical protein
VEGKGKSGGGKSRVVSKLSGGVKVSWEGKSKVEGEGKSCGGKSRVESRGLR